MDLAINPLEYIFYIKLEVNGIWMNETFRTDLKRVALLVELVALEIQPFLPKFSVSIPQPFINCLSD